MLQHRNPAWRGPGAGRLSCYVGARASVHRYLRCDLHPGAGLASLQAGCLVVRFLPGLEAGDRPVWRSRSSSQDGSDLPRSLPGLEAGRDRPLWLLRSPRPCGGVTCGSACILHGLAAHNWAAVARIHRINSAVYTTVRRVARSFSLDAG